MNLEEENAHLRAENSALHAQIARLEQRIAELERPARPPDWVKPARPKPPTPKGPRKQRAAAQNRARRRETPTQTVAHALDHCPRCQMRLFGTSVARRRQVIDVPPPPPVAITEHVVIKRWCPQCARWRMPTLALQGQIVSPQGRIGVRLGTLIAYTRTVLRLPVRQIQASLHDQYGCALSVGEIVAVSQQVAARAAPTVAAFTQTALASPVLHADETGWRENGQNGYIWCFTTPGDQAVRLYTYDPSRAGAVVQRLLTGQFQGHLVSDFYAGYNIYPGKHQRCWVHLLRDLHDLKQQHPADASVQDWASAVRTLYDTGLALVHGPAPPSVPQREACYVQLVSQAHQLGLQYAQVVAHPCWAIAKRLLRHEDELFPFVLVADLAADNNRAERSLRPLVVVRKISGGSRSATGSQTRMTLASLFGTWQARGLNPFAECLALLSQHDSFLQV